MSRWRGSGRSSTSRGSTRHLTGRQNLQMLAAAREPAARARIEPSLERVGILHRADDRVVEVFDGHAATSRRRRVPAR